MPKPTYSELLAALPPERRAATEMFMSALIPEWRMHAMAYCMGLGEIPDDLYEALPKWATEQAAKEKVREMGARHLRVLRSHARGVLSKIEVHARTMSQYVELNDSLPPDPVEFFAAASAMLDTIAENTATIKAMLESLGNRPDQRSPERE